MPKDFFPPKKYRQPFSDIIPSQKVQKEKNNQKLGGVREEKIEIKQESVTEIQESYRSSEISSRQIPRWPFILLFLIGVLWGLVYLGWEILPQLEVKIFLKKHPLTFNEAVETSKDFNAGQINASSTIIRIPGELFTENRNLQLSFSASGKEKIEKKAQGLITIYNTYSSDPQYLVVNTRFLGPDNKIFRLLKAVTIPGAKINEGKIIPSSIEVRIAADQPGAEYNIGPVAKFTIPGFKDSPKFDGFYAKSDQPMTGGFVGEVAVPTDKDIAEAKAQIKQKLEDSLKIAVFPQLPKEFKVIDGSSEFKILNEKINKEVDQENKFSIFAEAQMKLISFQEKDLRDVLLAKLVAQLTDGDYEAIDFSIEYGAPRSDFDKGKMSFAVTGKIIFRRKVNADLFRKEALGKKELDLKTLIFSLPDLEKAQISFWPIYIKKAPDKIEKIKLLVE